MKKQVTKFRDWIEDGLRRICGGLSPDARIITILSFCIIFGSLSIYMTVSSIYHIGMCDAEQKHMEIEHLKQLEIQHTSDSINLLKKQIYERQSNE